MVFSLSSCGDKNTDSKIESKDTSSNNISTEGMMDKNVSEDKKEDTLSNQTDKNVTAPSAKSENSFASVTTSTTTKTKNEPVSQKSDSVKQKIYDAYAQKIKELCKDGYYLYDMDADGVPEIFIDKHRIFDIYTYKNGIVKLGEVVSYGSILYLTENGKGLTLNRSLRETVTLSHLTIENGTIKEEEFLFGKTNPEDADEETMRKVTEYCGESLRNGYNVDEKELTMLKEVVLNGNTRINTEWLYLRN